MIKLSMIALKCTACPQFWTVHTLHPSAHNISHILCPDCLAKKLPVIDLDTRRIA